MPRAIRAVLCALGLSTGLASLGCSGDAPLDPKPPLTRSDAVAPADPPLSRLDVPVAVPLDLLVRLLDDAVPRRFGSLDTFHDVEGRRASVAFDLERQPFVARVEGDEARVRTEISYRVRVSYDLPLLPDPGGSCGLGDERRPRLAVALASPLALDSTWSLSTDMRIVEVRPASTTEEDRCQVTMLGIDITDELVSAARSELEARLASIDTLSSEVDLRSRFEGWWSTLRQPVQLDEDLWLSMRPERIARGAVRGVGDSVFVTLALGARPRIDFGERPDVAPSGLPPLETGTVEPGLDLLVDARAEYAAASRYLQQSLGGHDYRVRGRRVHLDSLRVYGIGAGRLAMELGVSGAVEGRLFLTGRPALDARTGTISVPDLEWDVATRDLLVATVSWLADQGLRDLLRQRATWPSDAAVRWLAEWLDRGLNRRLADDLIVTGVVDSLRLVDVYAQRDALLVRVAARGSASLFVEKRED